MDAREVELTSTAASDVCSIDNSIYSSSSMEKKEKFSDESIVKSSRLIEAINETIAEQNARTKEITELLTTLEIEPKSMTKRIRDAWSDVEGILRVEGLPRVDETSLKIQMEGRKRDSMRKRRDERKLKTRYDLTCQSHANVLKTQAKIRESTEALQCFVEREWNDIEKEYENRIFHATKLNDCRKTADELELRLRSLKFDEHAPAKINEKYETCLRLVERTKELDKELKKYGELPANLSEARIMVEEKERYLEDLQRAMFEKMQS